jgi:hypothetical protein
MMCLNRRPGSKKSVLTPIRCAQKFQRSVTVAAIQEVVPRSSGQCVIAGFTVELYGVVRSAGVEHIVPSATPDLIVTAIAVDSIVAVLAVEPVVGLAVKYQIVSWSPYATALPLMWSSPAAFVPFTVLLGDPYIIAILRTFRE